MTSLSAYTDDASIIVACHKHVLLIGETPEDYGAVTGEKIKREIRGIAGRHLEKYVHTVQQRLLRGTLDRRSGGIARSLVRPIPTNG